MREAIHKGRLRAERHGRLGYRIPRAEAELESYRRKALRQGGA